MRDLKELIEFLKQYQVAEFDLDRGDLQIRLKFNQPAASSASLSIWLTWHRAPAPIRPTLPLLRTFPAHQLQQQRPLLRRRSAHR